MADFGTPWGKKRNNESNLQPLLRYAGDIPANSEL